MYLCLQASFDNKKEKKNDCCDSAEMLISLSSGAADYSGCECVFIRNRFCGGWVDFSCKEIKFLKSHVNMCCKRGFISYLESVDQIINPFFSCTFIF